MKPQFKDWSTTSMIYKNADYEIYEAVKNTREGTIWSWLHTVTISGRDLSRVKEVLSKLLSVKDKYVLQFYDFDILDITDDDSEEIEEIDREFYVIARSERLSFYADALDKSGMEGDTVIKTGRNLLRAMKAYEAAGLSVNEDILDYERVCMDADGMKPFITLEGLFEREVSDAKIHIASIENFMAGLLLGEKLVYSADALYYSRLYDGTAMGMLWKQIADATNDDETFDSEIEVLNDILADFKAEDKSIPKTMLDAGMVQNSQNIGDALYGDDHDNNDDDLKPVIKNTYKSPLPLLIGTVAVLAIIAVIVFNGATGIMSLINNSKKVVVPDYIGQEVSVATEMFKDEGLNPVEGLAIFSDTIAKGLIAEIDSMGEEVVKGSDVIYHLSKGKQIYMPDVTGMKEKKATDELTDMGLIVDIATAFSDSVKKGRVLDQSIEEGTEILEGNRVTITISLGPDKDVPETEAETEAESEGQSDNESGSGNEGDNEPESNDGSGSETTAETSSASGEPEMVLVPSLLNMTEEEGRRVLEDAGFVIGEVFYVHSEFPEGYVVNKTLTTGDMAPKGTVVNMDVSIGPW